MQILFIGDIIGKPGRKTVSLLLPLILKEHKVEFILANAENAAGGFGLTSEIAQELFTYGVDCLTNGNHLWDKKEIISHLDSSERILRPANYPPGVPGFGSTVLKTKNGFLVGVINIQGRIFIQEIDCPFRTVDREIERIRNRTKMIIVDVHAEVTSEKVALGWYLDGRVSCVIGTHTHVQTADEHILPQGTAYITDVGMTGGFDSVIGVEKEAVIKRFLTQMPCKFEPAKNDLRLNAVLLEIDPETGQAKKIKRVEERVA
ncbi:MAG: TIGR00282 family metallophosphoesterase [Candidatus Edwardsbacteria bacterium]